MKLLFLAAMTWVAYRIMEENRRPKAPVALLPSPENMPRRPGGGTHAD